MSCGPIKRLERGEGSVVIGNKMLSAKNRYTLEDDQAKARAKELEMWGIFNSWRAAASRPL